MALIKHKYTDTVVDLLWKLRGESMDKASNLVVSVVQVGKGDYAIRAVEPHAIRRDKGETVLADTRTVQVFLKKFDTYTKEQSTQFFYHVINTLLERQLATKRSA